MKTYIVNPDNGQLVSIEDWRKESDPTRAQLLALELDNGHALLVSKSYLPGKYTFEETKKACAAFNPGIQGFDVFTFRAPTRKECIDLYDARFLAGLDEAVELTGGNFAHNPDGNWFWTSEKDADPRYSTYYAWVFYGHSGNAYNHHFCYGHQALPVALYK